MRRASLVVMVKEPRPGRVKTRLGRGIGMVAAAWWFRHQVTRLLRRIDDPRWPAHLPRVPQGAGDLGDRMGRLFRSLPPGPVCIVGADIPGITRAHIARGFAALGAHDAVIGPAPDGGYWLIGLRRGGAVPARLFDGVRWSSVHARADTIRSLGACRVALIDMLRDVDTQADLAACHPAEIAVPSRAAR